MERRTALATPGLGHPRVVGALGMSIVAALAAACATPVPSTSTPPSTPPAAVSTPIPTATPIPTMAEQGLARVAAASGAQSWAKPGARGDRLELIPNGTVVYLMDEATARDGSTWWATPVSGGPFSGPISGWLSEDASDGSLLLEPINAACPPGEPARSAAGLALEPWFRVACYGSQELELEGSVRCYHTSGDAGVQGAPWQDAYASCVLDDVLALNGPAVTALLGGSTTSSAIGTYAVRGHFDDPGSQHCVGTGLGVTLGLNSGPGQPAAIQLCRQQFVVDEVLPPSGG